MENKYIERYIYAVTKRLPLKMQGDVAKELRANIDDMLGTDNPTDDQVKEVLQKLGHPRKLAASYLGEGHYVVAPEYYADYISTLKLVGIIFLIVSLVTGFISAVTLAADQDIWQAVEILVDELFSDIWTKALLAFALVTIGFWIYGEAQKKHQPKAWELKDLPELPKPNTLKIKKGGTIAELIIATSLGLAFVVLLQFGLPYFDQDVVNTFLPFFYFSIALDIAVGSLQLIFGEWRWPVVGVYTFSKLYSVFLAYFFLYSPFLNATWVGEQAVLAGGTYEEVSAGIEMGLHVLFAVIAVATIIELVQLWVRVIKAQLAGK